jgi:hypothetical protein
MIADLSPDDPHLERCRARVHAPEHGYMSVTVPLDAAVVISAWTGPTSS